MSFRTVSQNTFSSKRINSTNRIYSNYWTTNISGSSVNLTYNGSGWKKIAKDSSGNIYIVGTTNLGSGGNDTFIMKFDSSGAIVWQRAFGNSGSGDIGQSITITSADAIYICGYSGAATLGMFVAKYDTSGNLLAQIRPTSGASTSYIPMCIDVNNSTGDVYITGQYVNSTGIIYGSIIRIDSGLTTLLQSRIWGTATAGLNPYNFAIKVEQSTGNFYTCGIRQTGTAISVAKFASDTTLSWSFTYNIGAASNLAIDSTGNIYVSGYAGTSSSLPFLMKMNSSGSVIWTRRLTGISSYGYSLGIDSSDNIVMFCGSGNNASLPYSQYLVKFDSLGNLLWQNYLDGISGTDAQGGMIIDDQGNCVLVLSNNTGARATLFKFPGDGTKNNTAYTNVDTYNYYTSSYTLDVAYTLTPTTFGVTLGQIGLATGATYLSQTIAHTITNLVIP